MNAKAERHHEAGATIGIAARVDAERHGARRAAAARSAGNLISDNTYWQGKDDASHQMLNAMPQQLLRIRRGRHDLETSAWSS